MVYGFGILSKLIEDDEGEEVYSLFFVVSLIGSWLKSDWKTEFAEKINGSLTEDIFFSSKVLINCSVVIGDSTMVIFAFFVGEISFPEEEPLDS